jgi:glycosyltransferase involved in cell wall biosynthesis
MVNDVPGRPDVSVVIPTYQRWHRLGRTLRAALDQVGVNVEVVIVSDGEEKMPPGYLAPGEERVRVIYPPEAKGVAHARNLGVQAANAPWVAFLDDDDLWAPRKLAKQLEVARAADASWVFASALAVDDRMEPMEYFAAPSPDGLLLGLFEYQRIPAGCSNVLARTDFMLSLGGFDESLYQLADWDMWIRMAAAGRAASMDELLVAYVQHEESMLLTHRDWVFHEFNRLRAKHRALEREQGRRISPEFHTFWMSARLEDAGMSGRAILVSLYAGVRYMDLGVLANAARLALRIGRGPGTSETKDAAPSEPPSWMREFATS